MYCHFLNCFCFIQVPICNECVVIEHVAPEHQYERLADAYERQRNELQNLVAESKAKVAFCEDATSTLQNTLGDLQTQHDNAQSLINETFQVFEENLKINQMFLNHNFYYFCAEK